MAGSLTPSVSCPGHLSSWRTEGRMGRPISIPITVVLSLFAFMLQQVGMDAKADHSAAAALALACKGTVADKINLDAKPEPISMSIIVNLTARTVTGFRNAQFPITITSIDEVRISFRGLNSSPAFFAAVYGSIDRVTGAVEATTDGLPTLNSLTRYSLKCEV